MPLLDVHLSSLFWPKAMNSLATVRPRIACVMAAPVPVLTSSCGTRPPTSTVCLRAEQNIFVSSDRLPYADAVLACEQLGLGWHIAVPSKRAALFSLGMNEAAIAQSAYAWVGLRQ